MIRAILGAISLWAIPVLLVGIPLVGMIRKIKVYDVFIEGAKEGFQVAVRIIPYLVAILFAIAMFRASGAMDFLARALAPVLGLIGFPPEVLPMAIIRPRIDLSLASERCQRDLCLKRCKAPQKENTRRPANFLHLPLPVQSQTDSV